MRKIKRVRKGDGEDNLAELELFCSRCQTIRRRLYPEARVEDVIYCHQCGNVLGEKPASLTVEIEDIVEDLVKRVEKLEKK